MNFCSATINTIDGWLGLEVAKLLFKLAKEVESGVIVEIGSFKGKSTICLASGAKVKIYAIDPHSEGTYEIFMENINKSGFSELIIPIVKKSEAAIENVKENIALLFIDGNHEYESVNKDFSLWFPKLMNGGYIIFHDPKWPGVKRVLWEELYRSRQVGLIRRIEDEAVYAKKVICSKNLTYSMNRLNLSFEKLKHTIKKARRTGRKLFKKL